MRPEYILQKLKYLCEANNYSFYLLSKKSGVALSTISGLYARNSFPSIPTLFRLCQALQITLSDFFMETTSNNAFSETDLMLLQKIHRLPVAKQQFLAVYLEALQIGDEL